MIRLNLFTDLSKAQLAQLYEERAKAQEDGLRPRAFDPFINQVEDAFMMRRLDAWRYTEMTFLEEIAKRYFAE